MNIKHLEERSSKGCNWYEFTNNKGERVVVEIYRTYGNIKDTKYLGHMWYKLGYTDKPMESYLGVQTYVYDEEGCWTRYNPTIIPNSHKINFDWKLEATDENEDKLLNEVYSLAHA